MESIKGEKGGPPCIKTAFPKAKILISFNSSQKKSGRNCGRVKTR